MPTCSCATRVHSCAEAYKKAKSFGFKCSDSLKQLNLGDFKLADACCATCMKATKTTPKPKKTTPKPKKTCGSSHYKGDGNCDDENNNAGCAYDGGDCCPKTVADGKVKTAYCEKVGCKSRSCCV